MTKYEDKLDTILSLGIYSTVTCYSNDGCESSEGPGILLGN